MKYLKRIYEFFDDESKSYKDFSKEELRKLVSNDRRWEDAKKRKEQGRPLITDLPYDVKDEIQYNDSGKEMLSVSHQLDVKFKKINPLLNKFKLNFESGKNYGKLIYSLENKNDIGVFNCELEISKYSNNKYMITYSNFMQKRLHNVSSDVFKIKEYELSSYIDEMVEELKESPKYKELNRVEILKELEILYKDLKDGYIVDDEYEDMDVLQHLNFSNFRVNEEEINELVKQSYDHMKLFDEYTLKFYNFSLFNV